MFEPWEHSAIPESTFPSRSLLRLLLPEPKRLEDLLLPETEQLEDLLLSFSMKHLATKKEK